MTIEVSKILVPVDFSAVSALSVEYAVSMAEKFNAELLVLHVMEDTGKWGLELGDPVHVKDRWDKEEKENLTAALGDICEAIPESIKFESKILSGDVSVAIVSCLAEEKCDFLVMGAHGSSGVLSEWLGGVAYKVSKKASCPVLMVRNS